MSSKIAFYGVFSALAIIISYFERLIPLPVPVPGIKLGLANVVVLMVLYYMGSRAAFGVSLTRIVVAGFLFAGMSGMLYSMSGGMLSLCSMALGRRIKPLSPVGVSVIGGVFHNIAQIVVAALVVDNYRLLYYIPVLTVMGVIAGVITGVVASYSLSYVMKRPIPGAGRDM